MLAEQSGLILFPARRKVRIPQIGKRHSMTLPKPGRGYVVGNRLSDLIVSVADPTIFKSEFLSPIAQGAIVELVPARVPIL
jgi:hypothetical protein